MYIARKNSKKNAITTYFFTRLRAKTGVWAKKKPATCPLDLCASRDSGLGGQGCRYFGGLIVIDLTDKTLWIFDQVWVFIQMNQARNGKFFHKDFRCIP